MPQCLLLCTEFGDFAVICSVFVPRGAQHDIAESLCSLGLCWSERRDLNSGPPVPQTGALTGLRYAPTILADYRARIVWPQHAHALHVV